MMPGRSSKRSCSSLPMRSTQANLRSGHQKSLGSTQIADPQSLIFSPALFIAFMTAKPTFAMFDTYVLGLLGLAGLAILMFLRDRGWRRLGGIVAALAFAFGSSAAWRIQHIGQAQSYALLAPTL